MEKRLFLAIALSLLVLLAWSALAPKPQLVDNTDVTAKETSITTTASGHKEAMLATLPPDTALSLLKVPSEKISLNFLENLAAIQSVSFKAHQDYSFPLKYGFYLKDSQLNFKKESQSEAQVTFVHNDKNKKIIKRFTISNLNYSIELEVNVQNNSASPLMFDLPIILGVLDFSPRNPQSKHQGISVLTKEKLQQLNSRKDQDFDEAKFLAIRDRYFCAIVSSDSGNFKATARKVNNNDLEAAVTLSGITLNPGQEIKRKLNIYLGPQDLKLINKVNPEWGQIINYGTFDFISHILLQMLDFFQRIVHNWGLAIIILSLAVYFLLFPLSLKQMRSMKEMQVLQPKIEELRSAYKDNPQKLNKEIMLLYKEHKVNPLSGCLPLVLQMPIFFALYQALMRSINLKGAEFLWIKDLSEPDRLFILPVTLPVLGNEINILPILMTIGMFIQQKASMAKSTSGVSAEQQKIMMIIMPLMFGLIFYHMPSGLVLYWFVNSTLMLLYQLKMNRAK